MNKSVLSKLAKFESKVELTEVQIELNTVKDVEKQLKESEKEWANASKITGKISQLKNDAISAYKQARVNANQVTQKIDALEKQAKDLGLDLPAVVVQMKDKAAKYISEGLVEINKLS